MQHQELAPPAALQDTIKDFWYLSREFDDHHPTLEVAPDGYAEIIFYFGATCHLSTPTGWQALPSPFLVGLLQQPALFWASGRVEFMGIKCFPWVVFELLGLPAGRDGMRRVMAHPIAALQATLAEQVRAGRVAAALADLQQYCLQARARMAPSPVLNRAGGALRAAAGRLPVSQVAAAAHATVRTLERQFKQAAGHTVKDVAGLMRFEQACEQLWQHPAASLAGVAQQLGYADQSHLGREFKRYSGGTTPAAFARHAARWQREVNTDFVAFILA
jgi:AraC-like DNA-binding protein